jgi:energy-coupling factor transport system permease protein
VDLRPVLRVTGSTAAGQGVATEMNARAVAAWSAACLFIVLFTTNPAYKGLVLAAAIASLAAGAGLNRMRGLLTGVVLIAAFATLLNFISAHLGATVLFALPASIPALGGPYTLEALAAGVSGGLTVAAAIVAAAPFSLMLASHDVMDALPAALSRTGAAIAASLNLVPSVTASFVQVSEAQRLRGWRPRGPRSWAEVIVPVVLTSVEGSIQLAESMEARGFGSGPRTALKSSPLRRSDWVLVAASAAAVITFLAARATGGAVDWYAYPALAPPPIDIASVAACLLLFVPVVTWRSRV